MPLPSQMCDTEYKTNMDVNTKRMNFLCINISICLSCEIWTQNKWNYGIYTVLALQIYFGANKGYNAIAWKSMSFSLFTSSSDWFIKPAYKFLIDHIPQGAEENIWIIT